DVENVFRRLRENERLPLTPGPSPQGGEGRARRSALDVVLSASLEVRGAVVYATFVVVLVFVPVFFMTGLQGRLFAPLGHAYVLPGTSLPESMEAGRRITRTLKEDDAVRSVAQQAGRAELGEDTWGVEYSELEVDLHRGADPASTQRRLQRTLDEGAPGYSF